MSYKTKKDFLSRGASPRSLSPGPRECILTKQLVCKLKQAGLRRLPPCEELCVVWCPCQASPARALSGPQGFTLQFPAVSVSRAASPPWVCSHLRTDLLATFPEGRGLGVKA